jgi:hypothetical protein
MDALLITKLVVLAIACLAFGLLLGDRTGRSTARELWAPMEESLDDLTRELRLRELRGEDG